MAEISQVKLPDNSLYDIRQNSFPINTTVLSQDGSTVGFLAEKTFEEVSAQVSEPENKHPYLLFDVVGMFTAQMPYVGTISLGDGAGYAHLFTSSFILPAIGDEAIVQGFALMLDNDAANALLGDEGDSAEDLPAGLGIGSFVPMPTLVTIEELQLQINTWLDKLNNKMDKNNPIGTGSFSLNRKANTTIGFNSFAEGYNTTAEGYYSHAEGYETTASGGGSHAEGGNTTASGDFSHAEGCDTTASGGGSHVEGNSATASGDNSHAEGYETTASGEESHAEGYETTAEGSFSHAEGYMTTASNRGSHAEGGETTASGQYSHAEGYETEASGDFAHAEGYYTIAASLHQHAQGQYNIKDESYIYSHIVGNGESNDARSNAHTLDWDGNAWFAGDVYVDSTSGTNKDTGSVKLARTDELNLFYVEGSGSTVADKVATWRGSSDKIAAYFPGLTVAYKLDLAGSTTTKLDINGLGAVTVVKNSTTAISTAYPVNSIVILTYTLDSTTAYWKIADQNSTYSNASLGRGYTSCSTAAATTAKTASLSSYSLSTGGTVSVLFTNGNTASNPTLNVNSKGAKSIYHCGVALTDTTLIKANDVVSFIYDGSKYHILSIWPLNGYKRIQAAIGDPVANGTSVSFISNITQDANGVITPQKKTITLEALGITGAMRFLGTTTTALTDGSTTNPITISSKSVTATNGNVVLYNNKEFVWTGSLWELLGDEGSYSIKGHTHTVTCKPTGTVGETSVTPAGSVSQPTFTGTAGTTNAASSATFSAAPGGHTHTFTGTAVTSGNNSGSAVKAATAISGGSMTSSITNRKMTITFTGASISSTGNAAPHTHTHSVTAAGTIGANGGTNGTVSLSTHTHGFTPAGTVSKPTFTGTAAGHTHSFTGTEATHTTNGATS